MTHLVRHWQQGLLACLLSYGLLVGMSQSGLNNPWVQLLTLALWVGGFAFWMVYRQRHQWHWPHTALDTFWVLWGIAIAIAWIANLESSRRTLIGVVYLLCFVLLWYLLADLLANGKLTPLQLLDSLLLSSLPIVAIALIQIGYRMTIDGLYIIVETRIASTMDNPNILGGYVMVIHLLLLGRIILTPQQPLRIGLISYALLSGIVFLGTGSRGAWIGWAIGVSSGVVLLSIGSSFVGRVSNWWKQQSRLRQRNWRIVALLSVIVALGLFASQLIGRMDSIMSRVSLYQAALNLFLERPITGYGLGSYGRHLLRFDVPLDELVAYPHNLLLGVAAEMGMVGLVALGGTIILLTLAAWNQIDRTLTSGVEQELRLRIAAIVALIASAVHEFFDQPPANSPILAVILIMVAVIALQPSQPRSRLRPLVLRVIRLVGAVALGLACINLAIYLPYWVIINRAIETREYPQAADQLYSIVQLDTSMPIYWLNYGYLSALAGEVDPIRLQRAAIALEQFCAMEPYYPPAWGNLAVLYRMLGERELAVSAVRRAAELSARSSVYWYALGWMAEDVQQDDVAREAYQRAVLITPDLPLRSDWNDSVLRRSVRLPANKVSALARTMAQLLRGRTHNAWMTWRDAPSTERLTAAGYLADAWFALDRHDRHTAQMFIEWARLSEGTSTVYSRLGQSWLLRYDGNIEQADAELGILRRDIAKNLDNSWILSLSYVQYKVTTLPFIYLKELDASPVPITVQRMLDLKPER